MKPGAGVMGGLNVARPRSILQADRAGQITSGSFTSAITLRVPPHIDIEHALAVNALNAPSTIALRKGELGAKTP